jgi:phosphatidylglycerophosphatase C
VNVDPAVAAFDLDGTLTTSDCVVPFLRRLAGIRGIARAVARRPGEVAASVARLDRDRLKEAVVGRVYAGRLVADVELAGKDFAAEIERTRLRPDVLARLRWHQGEGHRTVIVSASLRDYVAPLAASLGIDHVLCTAVATDDGRYTDRLLGGNCRGSAKVARLHEWLVENELRQVPLWAYGDSSGDRYMLAAADHPVWVRGATVPAVPSGFAT